MRLLLFVLVLPSLLWGCGAEPERASGAEVAPLASVAHARPTTRPALARAGLDARIGGLDPERAPDALLDALGLRLALFGTVSDLDAMLAVADDGPTRAGALLAVHRFDEALDHDPALAPSVALARHEGLDALEAERLAAAAARPSTATWSAVGDVRLARGDAAGADAAYAEALRLYRDVSPLTVADLQFRRGLAWGESGADPERARALYEEAVRHLPGFVRANVHLAELEWEAGEHDAAIARVRRVAHSEDPEPGGKLAVWLDGADADAWRARTTARYDALLERHPLAFADHGAEYFLAIGEVDRAAELARANLDNRDTPRARDLCERSGC